MAVKIMIDAGHGGYDNGATYQDRKEKDDNLRLALAVGDILKRDGYDVVYTRTDDVYDSPAQKARLGNESGADYFVSIHRNSAARDNQYNGVQTLVYDTSGIKNLMAENVNKELEKVGYRNINVEARPDLAVLRRTNMPAILVEAGFINSDKDNQLFDSKFNETAEAIAKGISETIQASGNAGTTGLYAKEYTNTMAAGRAETKGLAQAAAETDVRDEQTEQNPTNGNGYPGVYYQILVGVYDDFGAARYQLNRLINEGYYAEIYEQGAKYQLRVGRYENIEAALVDQRQLRDAGYQTLIVQGEL